jgi:hypothetical protein
VMETYCDSPDEAIREKTLNLITHVEVESAHVSDFHALIPAVESTKERGLVPEEILADSLYGSEDNREKARDAGVEVISPVMGTPKEGTFGLADFPQTDKGKIAACPQGHVPIKFKQGEKGTCSVGFASEHCSGCPVREQCPVKPGKKRHYLRFDLKSLRIAGRRVRELTPEFKDRYRWRSGIESTFSEMDKKTGVKRLRVRGLSAVGYCARLKAIGVNLFRASRVKRALDALKPIPGTGLSTAGFSVFAVKELFLSQWRRLSDIFYPASENTPYDFRFAA